MAKRCIKVGTGRSLFANRPRLGRRGLRGQPATMSLKPPAGKVPPQGLELDVQEATVISDAQDSTVQGPT
jgi:hypothetical protein